MESQADQLDGNMRQQTEFMFDFAQIQEPPYDTFQYDPEVGLRAIDMLVVNQPIRNQTQFTENRTYNAPNLDPRTYIGGNAQGLIPYGHARGQISATSSAANVPRPMMQVNNDQVFRQVALDNNKVFIPSAKLTPVLKNGRVRMVNEGPGVTTVKTQPGNRGGQTHGW